MGEETELRLNVPPNVRVLVSSISGDLTLEGDRMDVIEVEGEEAELHLDEATGQAHIESNGDCAIRVPTGAEVKIQHVTGDAKIKDLDNDLAIGEIDGDLEVRDVHGSVTINEAQSEVRVLDCHGLEVRDTGSDLTVRDISGDVTIRDVGSDLEIKRVSGTVTVRDIGSDAAFHEITGGLKVRNVGSDVLIRNLMGNLEIGEIGSDLVLDVDFVTPFEYKIEGVGSDVLAKIGPDAKVRFIAPKGTEKSINVRGARIESDGDNVIITIGEDNDELPVTEVIIESIGSELQLEAQAKSKSGFAGAFSRLREMIPDNLDEIIAARINEAMPRIQESMNRQLERLQREAERIQAQAEREAERVRVQAEREAERARIQAERLREQAERVEKRTRKGKRGVWEFGMNFGGIPMPPHPPSPPNPPRPPRPPEKPVEPVTEQERLAILRMVENKQITIEEAERLLAALEGRE